ARVPLPGAIGDHPSNLSPRLLRIYGSRGKEVAELAKRLNTDSESAEIVFSFEREFAKTLSDCFFRRTMIGLNADRGLGEIEAAAAIGRQFLGWSEERAKREVENYREGISRMTCGSYE